MDNTKDKIMKTAFKLFRDYGIDNVSLNQIIKESGISGGGLYHHFETKEQLISEVERKFIVGDYERALKNINIEKGLFADKIIEVIKQITGYDFSTRETPEEYNKYLKPSYFLYLDCIRKDDENTKLLEDFSMESLDILKKVIEDGKKEGEVNLDLDTSKLAMNLLTLINGAFYTAITVPSVDLYDAFDFNITGFLDYVK